MPAFDCAGVALSSDVEQGVLPIAFTGTGGLRSRPAWPTGYTVLLRCGFAESCLYGEYSATYSFFSNGSYCMLVTSFHAMMAGQHVPLIQ